MTCFKCANEEQVRERARVTALEKQNSDLIAIVGNLLDKTLMFRFVVDPNQEKLRLADYQDHLAKTASRMAKQAIHAMLEDRRQFFYDYNLLRIHAGRGYWEARNSDPATPR